MVFKFLVERFGERFSWTGIFLVASAFGFELTEFQQYALTFLGMALFGAPDERLKQLLKPKKKLPL
jgi:hypothetical protein